MGALPLQTTVAPTFFIGGNPARTTLEPCGQATPQKQGITRSTTP